MCTLSRPYPRGGTAPVPDMQDEMLERSRSDSDEERKYAPYLVSGIVFPHLREILFEDLLVEGRFAHVYDFHWLTILDVR